jgi:DNA-binding NarL/FixJ family response regulator
MGITVASKMTSIRIAKSIRIGLLSDEPIRLAGMATIFDQPAQLNSPQLLPINGSLEELLSDSSLRYLVVDLHSSTGGLGILEFICSSRPDIRLIVIGPAGDDELVMNSIVEGARAYLDLSAGPEMVRMAIDVVTSGSIWAPRRLLSQLIDRLLTGVEIGAIPKGPQLTLREKQVLELIMTAQSNREIARRLGIEERTVKAYVGRLMRKTGADNRIKLSMSALGKRLAPPENES